MRLAKRFTQILGLVILGSAIPALASTVSVSTIPAAPTTDDVVVLAVSGQWADACAPGTASAPGALTRQGTSVSLVFTYRDAPVGCAAVITPWSTSWNLGKLPAGTYHVDVALSLGLAGTQPLGSGTFTVLPPQRVRLFAPSFLVSGAVTYASRLNAFNNGGSEAEVTLIASYDELGRHELTGGATLAPGASAAIGGDVSEGTLRFVEVETPTHVAFRASMERLAGGVSQGRVAMPVFAAAIPSGATAAAGEIRVSADLIRANLTLLNAGGSAATFTADVVSADGATLATHTYSLEAGTAKQFNHLLDGGFPAGNVWIRLTADQPFAAYASATYGGSSIPSEVFPARVQF